MNLDMSGMLKGWDYDPSTVSARWVKGNDGRMKVQLRLDLGIFQMEAEGRPDGATPHGYPSLLDYYRSLEKTSAGGTKLKPLDAAACAELQQEAMQYYYRYLSFYALRVLDAVVRDTEHNLGVLDLAARNAENEDLAWQFQQFYPYVRMMNARAQAEKAVEQKHYEAAVEHLQKALDDIQAFWTEHGGGEPDPGGQELELLSDLLRQVKSRKPKTAADRLREQLDRAVAAEDYEKAAGLRDKLNLLDRRPRAQGPKP